MRLKDIFKSRDKPKNYLQNQSFFFGASSSGKTVNEITAMQTSAVYACVRIIAETLASLPWHTYKYTDSGKEKALTHPLYYLLHSEPNPEMSSFVFRETLTTHLLLWGNAYAQIIRNGRGQILALYPLMPDKMRVDRNADGQIFYEYSSDTGIMNFTPYNVLHIPGLGFNGLLGQSPIAMAKNAIGLAISTEEYGSKFFQNDARPSVILEHPGKISNPDKVREAWNKLYQGSSNANKTAVLEEGMKAHALSIPPEQAQFLESRKFQINEICRIFRVPPHMVADLEKSSFSNIENQSREFVTYTLDPWVIRWEASIQRSAFSEKEKKEYFTKMNVDGLLRGDYQGRMNGYAVGRQNGWLSSNDIRELENLNKIPAELGGDEYAVNGNMKKLGDFSTTVSEGGG